MNEVDVVSLSSGIASLPIRLAVAIVPAGQRDRYREEWLADMSVLARDGSSRLTAGLWSLGILVASLRRSGSAHAELGWRHQSPGASVWVSTVVAFGGAFWATRGPVFGVAAASVVGLVVALSLMLHARLLEGLTVGLIIGVSVGLGLEVLIGVTVGMIAGLVVGLGVSMFDRFKPDLSIPVEAG